ncbi:protease SohB [Pasteurellaceae bacterium USgator11]|nr:protease SohB [Pasteurellaceae bacterium UScroc12]TNG94964.1 protease SohB [Pasteurellaceae bacterium USgator41]TNH00661.1 protease SohB [Pasteurellaceae bacterium UScroc31]TNH02093.1 protease SohB [Pasteurellaceae bacterium USgator11]
MWSEVLINYGVFILQILTVLLVIVAIFAFIVSLRHKEQSAVGELKITDLAKKYQDNQQKLANFRLNDEQLKQQEKARKKQQKLEAKANKQAAKSGQEPDEKAKPCVYVLNFKGDIQASGTAALADEISAILAVAKAEDEVLLRLESPGGVVHGYGLAASQLDRLKQKGIKLTVAVDKVAASGGYMMACVADKIVSAPFAVIGSVGVVAQIPNIHRLLKKHDVDVEVMTAGEYKRTMTILGENTEKGREKFQQELEETHQLFKDFVANHRQNLDLEKIATGEHWFGQQALDLGLVDEIATSDDLILTALQHKDVLEVKFTQKKSLMQKIGKQAEESSDNLLLRWLQRSNRSLY